ncbi:FG-GAP-like repeat-containing protein [Tautonia marina]|uniref:FG-GAP-like repeat-containing protein n=1 Tax=Tautonia marina TaxID=2653855 RepID=UPI001260FD20|nr:FG-GAP-like repeat-containing protein [Tautonia marina]
MFRFKASKKLGIFLFFVVSAAAGFAIWWHSQTVHLRTELERARAELDAGRIASARGRLVRLSGTWAANGEVDYVLGMSEHALGNVEAALRAWRRVPHGSPFAGQAALGRAIVEMDRGRLAEAEAAAVSGLVRSGPSAPGLRQFLVELLWHQDRLEEARSLLEANWKEYEEAEGADSSPAITTLRRHLVLDLNPFSVERAQTVLDRSGQAAPDDDRVWLGQANLAIRDGRYEEALRWLDACLERRPDDPAVWRSALELGLASHRLELTREALNHLPAAGVSPCLAPRIEAWNAARLGDAEAERRALDRLLDTCPGELPALDRLAELAVTSGDLDRASRLRRRKAELDEAMHRYRTLSGDDLRANAASMAALAESLGRHFEARAFWAVVREREPGHQEARRALDRLGPVPRPESGNAMLAERLPSLVGGSSAGDRGSRRTAQSILLDGLRFEDDARRAELIFTYRNGQSNQHHLPETMGGGVALLDFDGDGWLDVYAVQGGDFPPVAGSDRSGGDRLFRNRGDGTFEDVTTAAGIAAFEQGYGHGVTVGDYDNDGHPDLFITRWRSYSLYRNNGDGTFEDATEAAGLGGDRGWPTSAAFADFDGDGHLDLYVCHYLDWNEQDPEVCPLPDLPDSNGYCNPLLFEAQADHLFRNVGGVFEDVTVEAGLADVVGRGLGVVAADLDGNGLMDLYVANDLSANFLFLNQGTLTFEEAGLRAGVAANAEGGYQAGMGVACADLDGDDLPDLFVTNFYGEATTGYRNLGGGFFADRTADAGLARATRHRLGFGIAPIDAENDGSLDLIQANGHINDLRPLFPYEMPAQLLIGDGSGRLVDASEHAGVPFQVGHVGRGLAVGDLDNDGLLDALLIPQNAPLAALRNRTTGAGHFVTFQLVGGPSNRDAIGAKVSIEAGGDRQTRWNVGGGSYQSASSPNLHFGVRDATHIDLLEISWPSGRIDRHRDLSADTGYRIREGAALPDPLPGRSDASAGPQS